MNASLSRMVSILDRARDAGRDALLEAEGIAVLQAVGIDVPGYAWVGVDEVLQPSILDSIPSERVVIKVSSAEVLHKSDEGGVRIAPKDAGVIDGVIEEMKLRFAARRVEGFTIHEFVPYDPAFGNEMLLGARWTPEFGAVVMFGPGGIHAEFMSEHLKERSGPVMFPAGVTMDATMERMLREGAVGALITREHRGSAARIGFRAIGDAIDRIGRLAAALMPHRIRELEINPLVIHGDRLRALDVLVKLGDGVPVEPRSRPVHKIKNLLEPKTVAIAGVSKRMNPGHVILNNLIRDGFPRESILVVKPGVDRIEGCVCYSSIADLPGRVDLLVLGVDASQVPAAVTEIVENEAAESVVLISGGLEEKSGTESLIEGMNAALSASRNTAWGGPLINGGNSLGVKSKPGNINTVFIPEYKIEVESVQDPCLALISQSGAFAISRQSKLGCIDPEYMITVGNQMDVTVGDYLTHLGQESRVHTFAVYVEGFQELDGPKFLEAARDITRSGGSVVLYRAGRTEEGSRATASHTASIAGDYTVTRALCEAAGVLVAETIEDFEDLTLLCCFLRGKEVAGRRLGAVSNAGFECAAIADNHRRFEFARLSAETRGAVLEVLRGARLDGVIDINNPLDLTPISGESAYEVSVRAVLEDENVDVGIVGIVPLTPALQTLPAGAGHSENVASDTALPARLAKVVDDQGKACVVVIDSGAPYDAMARLLIRARIPVFRAADRALRMFDRYCASRLNG